MAEPVGVSSTAASGLAGAGGWARRIDRPARAPPQGEGNGPVRESQGHERERGPCRGKPAGAGARWGGEIDQDLAGETGRPFGRRVGESEER